MRICSLLPSATEIVYALGLGDSIVGVSHECDYPADAARKPSLLRPRVDPKAAPGEIDRQVSEIIARGESIYAVDAELLASLAPDLILTQDLCHVCAASPDDLATALTRFPNQPKVLALTPRCLDDVWDDVRRAGAATGHSIEAEVLASELAARVAAIECRAAAATGTDASVGDDTDNGRGEKNAKRRPRVLCLEWLDPFYVGGHWVPEMVQKAGGVDVLGREREPSFRVTAEQIKEAQPDLIVVMPCGYDSERTAREFHSMKIPEEWESLAAVRNGRFFAVDANAYFSRPGPRLADGVELLARLLHPNAFEAAATEASFRRLLYGQ
jgi:iron complex transport system substrate-binding protein